MILRARDSMAATGTVRASWHRQVHQDAGGRVLHLQRLEDGGAVVRDEDVADVVHEHLVQPHGAQGALDDVGHGQGRGHVADADVLPGLALPVDELAGAEVREGEGGKAAVA